MPALVLTHKTATDTLGWRARLALNEIIDIVADPLARALDDRRGTRRDVIAYTLASLEAARSASTGYMCKPQKMVVARAIASILGDPSDRSHSVLLDGLNVGGPDVQPATRSCSPTADKRCRQSDLLTRLWNHHPLLLAEVLSHVDAWGIGSVALTSSGHYAQIIEIIQEDDARSPRRLSGDVALAGTVWLRQRHDGHPCNPEAETVTPSFGGGPLPGLRPLLFLCRRMPLVASLPQRDEAKIETVLVAACTLGCGAAMTRCAPWLEDVPSLVKQGTIICGGSPHLQYRTPDWRNLALRAGVRGSPMLMRVAYTAQRHYVPDRGAGTRLVDKMQAKLIGRFVGAVVDGIEGGLLHFSRRHRATLLVGMPALVEVISGLLLAVRRDVDAHGPPPHRRTKLTKELRDIGFAILAPGARLTMPEARTRLALALFETANYV
nr:hypothetical protein [Pandoravirus massiliensis]